MSVCVSSNNNTMMTTSATSAELNDTNSVSTPSSTKVGIPAIPKRPTIIRVDKQNVQENTDESKSKEVPKVPPRPPPPRPGPPPVPSKQPVAQKAEDGKRKKKPEITIVSARPMSEVCFRNKKPEIPVPPRPQRLKDPGEVSSASSINCTSVTLSTECSRQKQHSTTVVRSKSSILPPQRPRLPPAIAAKKDSPKVPPQRPVPLKSTLSTSVEPSPPPRPPVCVQLENLQPLPHSADLSFSPQEKPAQFTSFGKTVNPPKPRPRTFIDSSLKPPKPVIVQRSASAYKPTKDGIPPQPLPRKHGSFSCALEICPVEELVAPPKPIRHQSFRRSTSPIPPSTCLYTSPPSESQEISSESTPADQPLSSATVSTSNEEVLDTIPPATEEAAPADKTDPSSSLESTEIPESFNLENETSSTDKTDSGPLSHQKNSLVVSQTSFECTSSSFTVDDTPVPCPRVKRSSKPDTPASTPVDPDPAPIVSDTPVSVCEDLDQAPALSDPLVSTSVDQDPAPITCDTTVSTHVGLDQDPVPVVSDTPASTPVDKNPAPITSDIPASTTVNQDLAPTTNDTETSTTVNQDLAPTTNDTETSTTVNQDLAPTTNDTETSTTINPDPTSIVSDKPASIPVNPDPVPITSDTATLTPVNPDPVTIVNEEPKDFILPSTTDILVPSAVTVNKPTIIRASNFIENPSEPEPIPISTILVTDSAEKQPDLKTSSEKTPLEETAKKNLPKDPEVKKSRVPPPIPKKNPISANICDRNVPNSNSTKTVSQPPVPKKPPKPCPPAAAPMPVKNKQKEPEAKVDGSSNSSSNSSSSSNLIKNLIFSKKSGSPSSSSTDLKKPSAVKSRKAADMLQSTKDYTRRITQSLGFTAAEEPSTVWYTDKSEEPEKKKSSLSKKKENPSIWYVDAVPNEETDAKKAPVPPKPALQADKPKKPPPIPRDRPEKPKEIDNFCQRTEEPSPTEIGAFQKYHSYMKRTIEEAVGIQLRQSSSSLIDEDINEEKERHGSDVMKPQIVKPTIPEQHKSKPPIPPKVESRPPKPSVPPQTKPNVPAVPPKRPPVPASLSQVLSKPEVPAVRPPPRRPKPIVSVKPTVPDKQNITKDSDLNSKDLLKSENRTPSIENLIGKFEEEICKKNLPPPRPAQPVNKPKSMTNILTDNKEQQLSSQNKETVPSADSKTETTTIPSNINDDSKVQSDENENLSVNAAEVGENTGGTEKTLASNLTTDSSIDENANEEVTDEPGKLTDGNTVANVVNITEESSVTETKTNLCHKVGYSDSFNQRCKSLMNDLKTHFDNVDKDDADDQMKEVVEPVVQSPDQLDVNPEKMQDSSSNEEAEEKELDEKVEPPSSEEKSSDQPSLELDMTEVPEKTSQEDSTSELDIKVEIDSKSCETSQEVSTLVIEQDINDAAQDPEEPPKSSSISELTGPRAIANFDFDASEEDELTLKKDDMVQLLSWVDTSWLYGNCHGKTGIFPLAFVHIIEPLPQTPSDTNGNTVTTDVSQESKMEDDTTKVSDADSQENSTQVMDDAYQSLSEVRTGPATVSTIEMEDTVISTKDEISNDATNAIDEAEDDELTDSDKLDKIKIPVGGEETVAYALYDFEGEDGELSFKEGDAITVLKWINEDWLLGKKEGLVGNLPANFVNFMGHSNDEVDLVDIEGPAEPKEPPPPLQADVKTDQLLTYVAAQLEHVKRLKGFACARFDFVARDEDELSFKDGDRIEIIEFVNNDWIRGSLHKREGIFPAAFVSVEEYSPDEENCTSKATKVRALHNFTASADDELSFKAGALITCYGDIPKFPGWSKGSFEGRTGMFPTEFVTQEGV